MAKVTKVSVTSPTSVAKLLLYIRTIMASVSDPANASLFPALTNPPPTEPLPNVPTYTQMKTAVDALETAEIKKRRTRTPADKTMRDAMKNVLVKPVEGYIPLWAAYVQSMSVTDLSIMQLSGFNLSDQPESIDELSQPENLRVTVYRKGGFRLAVNPVEDAAGIQWTLKQVDATTKQPLPNVEPITKSSTACTVDIDDLVSGGWYLITCYAFASGDVISTESNPIIVVCV